MEKKRSELRKLKRGFDRKKKQEVSPVINQQFNTVPRRVFANLSGMLKRDPENERPRYKDPGKGARDDSRTFESIEVASGFWRKLWEEIREGLNLRSGVLFFCFFFCFASLARDGKKITPDTFI